MDDDSAGFYADLKPFERFDDFVAFGAYAPLPDDWWIVIADVVGSTQAIREGRYKRDNMVGASAIMAALNVRGGTEIPYVFGGDGATLAVPGVLRDTVCAALLGLQATSQALFGLELRIGAVEVAELRAHGGDVRLRKYRLSPGNHLAMFAGDGITLAETWIKSDDPESAHRLAPDPDKAPPDLEGLSCRWDPLHPTRGRMMNLMVQATAGDPVEEGRVLARVIAEIGAILGHDLTESAPASARSMRFRWPPAGLMLEARYVRRALDNGVKARPSIQTGSGVESRPSTATRPSSPSDGTPPWRFSSRSPRSSPSSSSRGATPGTTRNFPWEGEGTTSPPSCSGRGRGTSPDRHWSSITS